MDTNIIKRLTNPMEMARSLAHEEVKITEAVLYGIVFVLLNVLAFVIDPALALDEFAFSWSDTATLLVSLLVVIFTFVAPAVIAWRKVSFGTYLIYFVSLNIPIMVLTVIAGIFIAEVPFMIINGAMQIVAISVPHFFLSSIVLIGSAYAMTYFMSRVISLQQK